MPQFREIAKALRERIAATDTAVVDAEGKGVLEEFVNLAPESRLLLLQEVSAKAITRWLWTIKRWRPRSVVWAARTEKGVVLGWGSTANEAVMQRCWSKWPETNMVTNA